MAQTDRDAQGVTFELYQGRTPSDPSSTLQYMFRILAMDRNGIETLSPEIPFPIEGAYKNVIDFVRLPS